MSASPDQNVSAPLPTAPLFRRIGAIIYDSLVILALWMVVGYVVLSLFGIDRAVNVDGERVVLDVTYRLTLFSAMMLSAFCFFGGFWTHSGQTIGMLAWKIRIQNHDGSAINWHQALIRCLVGAISLLLAGIGHWWMLVDSRRETLPDRVSGSQVVHLPKSSSGSTPQ